MYPQKYNCVHDNPYKTYCTIIPQTWGNPTGRQLSVLPFGSSLFETIKTNVTNNVFPVQEPILDHHMYPNPEGKYMVPQTLNPRPAVRIGYEWRN